MRPSWNTKPSLSGSSWSIFRPLIEMRTLWFQFPFLNLRSPWAFPWCEEVNILLLCYQLLILIYHQTGMLSQYCRVHWVGRYTMKHNLALPWLCRRLTPNGETSNAPTPIAFHITLALRILFCPVPMALKSSQMLCCASWWQDHNLRINQNQ